MSLQVALPFAGVIAKSTFQGVRFVALVSPVIVETVFVFVGFFTCRANF